MPKTSSAWAPSAAIVSRHAAPSPAACRSSSLAFTSVLVARKALSPSGKSVAVGWSVLRYSSPRWASSPPSSACPAPPTHNGCHALKTSWWKPGCVSSAVLIAPPSSRSRSRTHTFQPPRARRAAQTSELMPLPTTTASWSGTGEIPELRVGDKPALPGSQFLDPGEELSLLGLAELEAELLRLDPD